MMNASNKVRAESIVDKIQGLATFYKSIYTGKNQESILLNYRKNENDKQKAQRKRITRTRTKHVCNQIENIYDKLRIIDKAVIRIDSEEISDYVHKYDLQDKAYSFAKYFNIIDSNAHLIFGEKEGEPYFTVVESKQFVSYKYDYDELIELGIKDSEDNIIIYRKDRIDTLSRDKREEGSERVKYNDKDYWATSESVDMCYAFRLGFKKDIETNFNSTVGVLDPASELFRSLIWEGSELDIIKATHGIIRTWAYARTCNHRNMVEGQLHSCEDGWMKCQGEIKGKCQSCNGTGMRLPSSSQDVIFFEEPLGNYNDTVPLDKMVHQQTIDNSLLQLRREELEQLESKIIRSVFNSNQVTQRDLVKTATEVKIDQEGVVSALGALGQKVSETFIWMCKCLATHYNVPEKEQLFYHGYSMDFNLDTVSSLVEQRKMAVEANVPKHVVDVIDFAILKKQHNDNPAYLNKLSVWEKFRPFADKELNEKLAIVALLPVDAPKRLLYYHFNEVKTEVLEKHGDKFYQMDYKQQKKAIFDCLKEIATVA